jgi:diguanylate cyclase (GGDEF)-like protein
MKKYLEKWRYYSLGREEYAKCMDKTFMNNLNSLRHANMLAAAMAFCFTAFPLFVEKNITKAGYYLVSAVIAIILSVIINYRLRRNKQKNSAGKQIVYALIIVYYMNVILFGIYLGVFADPENLAVSFMVILICALLLFNLPSVFCLCFTLGAMILFCALSVMVKDTRNWSIDVTNALFAGSLGLLINWILTRYRMTLASTASRLEAESSIDELTQLKNRRDFMQTIQRYLSNHRRSDDLLCLGILDIDLFKNYNDHYGHPRGDECLRAIGKVLGSLKNSMNIYAARIGGEEFALIWFEENASNVKTVAEKINQMIRDLNIPHEKSNVAPYVTISIGVHIAKCDAFSNVQVLYDLADKALYTAKSGGRDRTVITS